MKYRYVTERENYEDLASGRVLLSQPGAPSFPVRLASEIFQRCDEYLPDGPLTVFDPCCGGGYLLTVLGFLHSERIAVLYGADIVPEVVGLAQRNLDLLTDAGLTARRQSLEEMLAAYGKDSHKEALESANRLHDLLPQSIDLGVWAADATRRCLPPNSIDLLITDVPYGVEVSWRGDAVSDPITALLDAQLPALKSGGIAAIISDKKQRAAHPAYERRLHDTLGKRRITILQK
ncbi:MAG: hypothetical protein KC708_11425 [Anaerolineae bacterium]|nr:hypothetical protein [Anaerolineae bacterium]